MSTHSKVTAEHRTAALVALGAWMDESIVNCAAQAIADAEERGRQLDRADALAWLRSTPARWTMGETPWAPVERALSSGEHVGKAGA